MDDEVKLGVCIYIHGERQKSHDEKCGTDVKRRADMRGVNLTCSFFSEKGTYILVQAAEKREVVEGAACKRAILPERDGKKVSA